MIDILNVRDGQNAGEYLVNGHIVVNNTHELHQGVLQWVNDGKEVMPKYTQAELDLIAKSAIPQVVSMRQARLALLESNLLATVDNAISTGTDEALKIEWEYAQDVRRDWQSLIDLATSLNLTSTDLDNLFILASTK